MIEESLSYHCEGTHDSTFHLSTLQKEVPIQINRKFRALYLKLKPDMNHVHRRIFGISLNVIKNLEVYFDSSLDINSYSYSDPVLEM